MENQPATSVNKMYLITILLLMLVLPCISIGIDRIKNYNEITLLGLIGKWFVFWSVGVRLFTAGLKQSINPSFTAKDIFHLEDQGSFIIVRELGYANICMGATGIISLFFSEWRIAGAFVGGLYLGIAGVNHIIKKPASLNEVVAMVSDLFIAIIMAMYVLLSFN